MIVRVILIANVAVEGNRGERVRISNRLVGHRLDHRPVRTGGQHDEVKGLRRCAAMAVAGGYGYRVASHLTRGGGPGNRAGYGIDGHACGFLRQRVGKRVKIGIHRVCVVSVSGSGGRSGHGRRGEDRGQVRISIDPQSVALVLTGAAAILSYYLDEERTVSVRGP